MEVDKILQAVTPDIYRRFKQALEIRRWPDGRPLTQEQIELCLQAVIAFELKHLPESERTGYVPPKAEACREDRPQTLKWRTGDDV